MPALPILLLFMLPVTGLSDGESLLDRSEDELKEDEDELSDEVELERELCGCDLLFELALDECIK